MVLQQVCFVIQTWMSVNTKVDGNTTFRCVIQTWMSVTTYMTGMAGDLMCNNNVGVSYYMNGWKHKRTGLNYKCKRRLIHT